MTKMTVVLLHDNPDWGAYVATTRAASIKDAVETARREVFSHYVNAHREGPEYCDLPRSIEEWRVVVVIEGHPKVLGWDFDFARPRPPQVLR